MKTLRRIPSAAAPARRPGLTAWLALALLALAPSVRAQALSGLSGTVSDQAGLVMDGVQVTVTNTATGVVSRTTTGNAGSYAVTGLIPGTYMVKFEKAGFQSTVHKGVTIEVSRNATVDAALVAGGLEETLEVAAPVIAMETDQPETGWTVERKVFEELPIDVTYGSDIGDRGRQIDALLSLVPGVNGGSFSHRINGGVDFQNEVVFDGVPVAQAETQGLQANINPPYEMVSEARVLGSVFSAQYGLGQGVASYRFASGANQFHGDAFELLRNDALDAAGHTPNEPGKPDRDKRHNFGFTLSGPVIIPGVYNGRDKTFFHFSSEWFREHQPVQGRIAVPTDAMKQGDFSAFPQLIYVPAGGLVPGCVPGAAPGQPFPGNRIPSSCFSQISRGILPLIPGPQFPGFDRNLASQIADSPINETNWGFSLDHQLTATQSLHLSFWRHTWNQPYCCDNNALFANELTGAKDEPRLGKGLFATYQNVFNDHLSMTVGFGYMREQNNELNQHLGFSFPGVLESRTFPTVQFDGNFSPNNWGAGAGGEYYSNNNKLGLSFANNWLYVRGRHTLNFGFEARRSSQDDQECQSCGAQINFSSRNTANPAALDNTGSAFASFLLGVADSANRQFVLPLSLQNFYLAPYIQDNFRVGSRLTVDFGVRWDIMVPFTEKGDNVVFFDRTLPNPGAIDPRTNQPLLGALNKLGASGYQRADIDWHQFSPRLGLVYKLNDKTVLLSGVAINHLDTGAFEFGTNKVAVNYGGLLTGTFDAPSIGTAVPGYGQWDSRPIPNPPALPFSSTLGNGHDVNEFARDAGRAAYVTSWNAGFQRELPWNMLLSVSYVGNRAVHLPGRLNPPKQLDPNILGELCTGHPNDCVTGKAWTSAEAQAVLKQRGFAQCNGLYTPYCDFINDRGSSASLRDALRPFPQFNSTTNNFETNGTAFYNALQTSAQKRFSNGLSFLVAYTLSKSIANVDSGFSTFNANALNKFNQRAEWAASNNDHRHYLNLSGVYELPIGKGSSGLKKNLLAGWQLSATAFYFSGSPHNGGVGANGSPLGTGNRANYDPNVPLNLDWKRARNNGGDVMFPSPLPGEATPFDIFNIAAFSSPGRYGIGNSPRNIDGLVRDWSKTENVALGKHLYFGKVSGELRIEFFNVFNRSGTCDVSANVDDRDHFGLVNGARIRDASGRVIGVHFDPCQDQTPRKGQAYVKISF
jgi:hypothetical protein